MKSVVWLYVDSLLSARDILLQAGILVTRYDLYPNRAGGLLVSSVDRKRAVAMLARHGFRIRHNPPEHVDK
jgi:hypothetical protein